MKKVLLFICSKNLRDRIVYTFKGTAGCEALVIPDVRELRSGFSRLRREGDGCGETFPTLIILDCSEDIQGVTFFVRWLRTVEHWSHPILCTVPREIWDTAAVQDLRELFKCECVEPWQWIYPTYRLLTLV